MKNHAICETIQRFSDDVKNAIGHKIALGTTLALFMFNGFAGAQSGPLNSCRSVTSSIRPHPRMPATSLAGHPAK
jgi:hypothetical protein